MRYKLINSELGSQKDILSVAEIVLKNRGIIDFEAYLNLDDSYLHSYKLLGENLYKAIACLNKHIEQNSKIGIVQDTDADGVCSTAILYQYLCRIYKQENIVYILHRSKQHGVSKDLSIPSDIQLLFLPDSGSNDIEECNALIEKGLDIIVLDHHQIEKKFIDKKEIFNKSIVVNPYNCQYPNKQLSGGAVVYKFLQAFDDDNWYTYADDYLDLVALSLVSDVMDLTICENKRLVDKGLSRITNKAFLALLKKQEYSTNGIVSINNVSYYITPLINGLLRVGSFEDKELLLRAFLETDEIFDYTKNSKSETVQEIIYDRVARIATNAKAKQNRDIDKAIVEIEKDIQKHKWADNKLLFIKGGEIDGSLTGLICMKLASKYSKPCILLKDNSWKPGYFGGSIRNFDGSPIDDLKEFLLSTNQFEFVQGHPNAAGLSIEKDKIRDTINLTNELLKDVDFDKVWKVDFIVKPEDLTFEFVHEINELKDVAECLIAIEGIKVNTNDITIMGSNMDSWKFGLDEVNIVKFKCGDEDEILKLKQEEWGGVDIELCVVGKINFNLFNGIVTPQIVVMDCSLGKE